MKRSHTAIVALACAALAPVAVAQAPAVSDEQSLLELRNTVVNGSAGQKAEKLFPLVPVKVGVDVFGNGLAHWLRPVLNRPQISQMTQISFSVRGLRPSSRVGALIRRR